MEKASAPPNIIQRLIDGISAIFMPLAGLLSAAGIMKGIIAIFVTVGILAEESQTYLVLEAVSDSLFYFLPFLLAVTSAGKFKANPYMAMVIAGVLLYPALTAVMEKGVTVRFFGMPLKGVVYRSGVLPIIMGVGLLAWLERFFNRLLPQMVKGFLTPFLCVPLAALATLAVFGPLGALVGDALAAGYQRVYGLSPVAAGLLLGGAIQPMLLFGFHWSFLLLGMNNVLVTGQDTILALIGPAVFAQAGAALAVMLKSRDKIFRSLCASAVLSALFGVTEPAMFNINLPRKKPLIAVVAAGAIGGAAAGLSGVQAHAFAFPSLATLPVFFGHGFGLYLISCLAGFVIAFALTMVMRFSAEHENKE